MQFGHPSRRAVALAVCLGLASLGRGARVGAQDVADLPPLPRESSDPPPPRANPWVDTSPVWPSRPNLFNLPTPPRVEMSFFGAMHESIFGAADEANWKPLPLRTFFTEGWLEPYYKSPEGTNGARPQYWLGAPSAVFGRDLAGATFYTNRLNNVAGLFLAPNAPFLPVHPGTNGNQYAGYTSAEIPLNQRAMLYVGTSFIDSNKSNPAGPYVGNWGDSEVQLKLRMVIQRNFSLLGFVGDRIPTGQAVNGNGINFVNEGFEFWWNFAPRWVVRGSSFINVLTGRTTSTTVYINQLSIGRYLTTDHARHFRQLAVHCTVSSLSDISGGRGFVNDVYVFPAFRFELDRDQKWYFLGGVNVPVSGPQPFDWQPQLAIYKYF